MANEKIDRDVKIIVRQTIVLIAPNSPEYVRKIAREKFDDGYEIVSVDGAEVTNICGECRAPVFESDDPQPDNDIDLCSECQKD